MLVGFVVVSNLLLVEIIEMQDYFFVVVVCFVFGDYGVWFIVVIVMMVMVGGIFVSVFVVFCMLVMLMEMKFVLYWYFGMFGSIQKYILVYIVVLGLIFIVFFDLL